MKDKFSWYLDCTPDAASKAWENCNFSVDTNVLLDLYRYHSSTCESILAALEKFGDKAWLSHQAASEFFANRKSVIVSTDQAFGDAEATIDKLSKLIDDTMGRLKNNRLVKSDATNTLTKEFKNAVAKAYDHVKEARNSHPNYIESDPILDRLLSLFNGKVGEAFSDDKLNVVMKEADVRYKDKIPPGYMDDGKEGNRQYGDFLMWSQIIEFAKGTDRPFVFVTSEQKEDWWEKRSGKTLGPRLELIEEFRAKTGQQIHIYHTETFLKIAAQRDGKPVTQAVMDDIRQVNAQRLILPAVEVDQLVYVSEIDENVGALEIDLLRSVFNMTGSGRFSPRMIGIPSLAARVVSQPEDCPPIDVRVGTGTNFDFNVHLRPRDKDVKLPVGRYQVEYTAVCEDYGVSSTDDMAAADDMD